MFKNYKIPFFILLVVLLVIGTMAATWNMSIARFDSLWVGDTDDTSNVTVGDDDVYIKGTLEVDGGVLATIERHINLPLNGFFVDNGTMMTAATTPGIEEDDLIPNIVWADGEVSPVVQTFRIPADYSSGGAFRVIATESNSSTPNQIDFEVYVSADGAAADADSTLQTPVALAGTTATPDVVTLTPATDFASLAAGQWVTLYLWRDDAAAQAGTGDLEVKGVDFYYTATQ